MSGNSSPRPRKRTARFRMILSARTVGPLDPEEKTNIARRSPSPTAGRHLVLKDTTCPRFGQKRAVMRRGHAQPGGIPRFIVLSAGAGAGTCHRAESDCVQRPDPGWPFARSCRSTSNRRARSQWATRSSSAPAAGTGLVPLDNLCFISIRRDCGSSCRGAKSQAYSNRYCSAHATGPCPVFIPEGGEFNCRARLGLYGHLGGILSVIGNLPPGRRPFQSTSDSATSICPAATPSRAAASVPVGDTSSGSKPSLRLARPPALVPPTTERRTFIRH